MQAIECAWTADEPIRDLALHADWDSVTSMIEALRIYWFEYGTAPTWNYFFCGGRPELSVPFSWAYTWPSLFAYAFEPNLAIITIWVCMSMIGFLAMRALLQRWTGDKMGAGVGACTYVLCGVFVTAFNRGHVPWAFYHFIPLLMLIFERYIDRKDSDRRPGLALMMITSFCFFTSGLPHGLIYFYPAFAALVVFRFFSAVKRESLGQALNLVGTPILAHLLGLWLSMYKLWPAIRWQFDSPRPGVFAEFRTVGSLLWDTVGWYNPVGTFTMSFVGPAVWLIALYAIYCVLRDRRSSDPEAVAARSLIAWVVIPVLVAGGLLALTNDNPLLPAYWFRHLPVLNAVRGLIRYLILTTFALSVLVAYGLSWIRKDPALGRFKGAFQWGLAIAILAPILANAAIKIRSLPAHSISEIQSLYPSPRSQHSPELLVMFPRPYSWIAPRPAHAVAALQQGYWLANCRSDLALPHIYVSRHSRQSNLPAGTTSTLKPPKTRVPISDPPPVRVAELTHNQIVLEYDPNYLGWIKLNLSMLDTFSFSAERFKWRKGRARFKARDLEGHRLIMTASYPGPRDGALASAAGLLGAGLFFWTVSRRHPPHPGLRQAGTAASHNGQRRNQ